MGLQLVTAPTVEPVSLTEAKAYLAIDSSDHDALLASLIAGARSWAESYTNRALVSQRWRLTLDEFPVATADNPRGAIELPMGRTLSVASVAYVPEAGGLVTLAGPGSSPAGTAWELESSSDGGGLLLPAFDTDWPDTRADTPGAVRIEFLAGYGPAATDVPPQIRTAILYRVADMFENRGGGDGQWTNIARSELGPFRLWDQPA